MKTSTLRMAGLTVLGLALAGSPAALAQADEPEAYGDDYQSGDYGRIRFLDGGATIVRADASDEGGADDDAMANAPLFPGDRIRTGRDQRVEIQLAGGTILRLDGDTELGLQSLPRPYAKYRDNTVILLDRGIVRVDAHVADDEFRFDTPAGSVYLLGDGDFRIEADPSGRTRVLSRRGVAEVVGEGGSVLVRGGSRTTVYAGTVPEDARPFSAYASDGFDRWVEGREGLYRARDRYEDDGIRDDDLPYEVRPYYRELSAYGRWVNVPDYGWAWYPSDVGTGWRPYYDGSWSYGPHGYFWVGNEPWGWAPYRYGRWSWVGAYGWCWVPGRVFAGAWVSWSWGSLYVGWAPLDFWGRPAFIGGTLYGGYYDPGCWTFLSYQHIGLRDARRHAVPIARVGDDLRGRPAVVRAPMVSPRRLAASRDWRERAARQAAEDARYRVRPIAEGRTPTRRLRDVEDRLVQRGGARAADPRDARGGGAIREPRRDPRRETRPMPQAPADRAERGTRGAGEIDRRNDRSDADRARYPRRIVVDPRAGDPGRGRAGSDRGGDATPPGIERRRDVTPRDTNDRVRDLYDRLSRPREMRESQPRGRQDEPQRAAPAPRREAPPSPRIEQRREPAPEQPRAQPRREAPPSPRIEPRREPAPERPRAQPRPEPQPRPQPRPEPSRPAPKREQERGDHRKDRR